MKNQYFGDIGDFGKYALLRHFADAGIGIGINWYLTDSDDSNDGKMTQYLESDDSILRSLDEGLFDSLRRLVIIEKRRDVKASEKEDLIKDVIYYHEMLDISKYDSIAEKQSFRKEWHRNAMAELKDASLIYFDPDNGIADERTSAKKDSVKYLLTGEAADYYNAGHDIVYYCHKGRRKENEWEDYKRILKNGKNGSIPLDARLIALTYHRGVQRTFIFAIHPERSERYETLLKSFEEKWKGHFEQETVQDPYQSNINKHIKEYHNGVNFIIEQIEDHLNEPGFVISLRTLKYLYTYGVTTSNLINEKGYADADQLCDLLRICSILRHFGSENGFDGNQSDAFSKFICDHTKHDTGNVYELPEDFRDSYSKYL